MKRVGSNPGFGIYPHVRDKAQMSNHQALYLVSIRLIFVFILALSVPCGKVRLQSTTDKQLEVSKPT